MPKISEEKRQARRDQILAASWRCFARRGLHSTSMEDIVREAKLSFGAVYLYYKSKDELIQAAFSAAFQAMQAFLAPIFTREPAYPPCIFVHEITTALTAYAHRDQLNFGVSFLMGWGEAEFNPKVKELVSSGQMVYREAHTAVVRKWQERGEVTPEANPENIAKVMLSFFLGFIVQSAMIGEIDPETATRGFEGILSSQLAPRR
jgi:AcrR family transcriptional regulator